MAYLRGERCFNDAHVVAAFQAVHDLVPYFPENHALLGYIDSLELFLQGKAAMWMSGSWDIPYLEDAEPDFDWSVFAVPAPAGEPTYVVFHLDVAIGLAAASQHQVEAQAFLKWMTTPAFGALLAEEIPGFFPMHRSGLASAEEVLPLTNPHVTAFLALNESYETDIRFAWELLRDGTPSGYNLMQDGALAVLWGEQTPQEAADALQAGLAQWFAPAQRCKQ
jgi:raffinose/stachyose/melibiose transport system substrate-binding protein